MSIITRAGKGLPLTHAEVDGNLAYLEGQALARPRSLEIHGVTGVAASNCTITSVGGHPATANIIQLWPFIAQKTITIDRIWLYVISAASANVHALLYAHNESTGLPTTRIAKSATAYSTGSRGNIFRVLDAPLTLVAGTVYWCGHIGSANSGSFLGTSTHTSLIRAEQTGSWMTYYYGLKMDSSFADPASSFVFLDWANSGNTAGNMPRMLFNDIG